jgi:hypothetical protein
MAESAARTSKEQTNAYEGIASARQLVETVGEFLARLPPATSMVSRSLPWIHIANPFVPRPESRPDFAPASLRSFLWSNVMEIEREMKKDFDALDKSSAEYEQRFREMNQVSKRIRILAAKDLKATAAALYCTTGKVRGSNSSSISPRAIEQCC